MAKNIKLFFNKNLKNILIILLSLFLVLLFLGKVLIEQNKNILNKNNECPIKMEERIVQGTSMEPVIKEGQKVKILFDYYKCHPILREDIILYRYSGNENPLIKRVKGVEGDDFKLKEQKEGWLIYINNQPLKNSLGQYYLLNERSYRLLSLYERDYKGKIPEGAYLILGEDPYGSLDSTRFGFVSKDDILGKVIYENNRQFKK
jgi:signal peptidase I